MKEPTTQTGTYSGTGWSAIRIRWMVITTIACVGLVRGARAEDWVSFGDQSCRIGAIASVINDVPCTPGLVGTCATSDNSNRGVCACEKDMGVGDLNGDGDDDLVIVRKQPLYTPGGKSNLLFLNEDGIMFDRSSMVLGFEDCTSDRDV